jgi:membrane associated rhomboid family serine protease
MAPNSSATIGCLIATCAVSLFAFQNRRLLERCLFIPEAILAGKEYERLVLSSLLHADFFHLAFNMWTLYLFGAKVETWFGPFTFLLIYLSSIIGGGLLSLWLHRHHDYRAYGASGGVAGVVFASIFFFPADHIYSWPIPIGVPGWVYAVIYLVGSTVALKRGKDNIGHDAHLGGAVAGLAIAAALHPDYARSNPKFALILFGVAIAMLAYLYFKPLWMPSEGRESVLKLWPAKTNSAPQHPRVQLEIDLILEKISEKGLDSLTDEERALLNNTADKLQRRAQVEKPKSGLVI